MTTAQYSFSEDAIRRTAEQYIKFVRAHSDQESGDGVQDAEQDFHTRFTAQATERGWEQAKIDAYWTAVEEMTNVL